MDRKTGQVLKSDKIKLEGRFHLDMAQAKSNKPLQNNPARNAPQVRILQNNPEYAVIGIICVCGTEMSIRCDYAQTQEMENQDK